MALGSLMTSDGGTGIAFEVSSRKVLTWSEARVSGSSRWHTHEIHAPQAEDVQDRKPRREYIGPGLQSLSLSIRIDQALGIEDVNAELVALRSIRDQGQVVQFVEGDEVVGDFTIDTITEEHKPRIVANKLTCALVELQLTEYV